MPAFLEERLDTSIGYPSSQGKEFAVEVHETLINRYVAMKHPYPRASFSLLFRNKTFTQMYDYVIDLFHRCGGMAGGFRVKNKSEFTTNNYSQPPTGSDQRLLLISAPAKTYQMVVWYGPPVLTTPRRLLYKIVAGTVQAGMMNGATFTPGVEGVDYTVNYNTGVMTLTNTPGVGDIPMFGCEFDIPVQFVQDLSNIALTEGQVLTTTIELLETLNPASIT